MSGCGLRGDADAEEEEEEGRRGWKGECGGGVYSVPMRSETRRRDEREG